MKKRIISLFTFGLALIIIGAITKLFNWSQATIIIALGLTFESFALVLFTWNRLKK